MSRFFGGAPAGVIKRLFVGSLIAGSMVAALNAPVFASDSVGFGHLFFNGSVVGTVVATRKDPRLEGKKLLILKPISPEGKDFLGI